MFSSKQIPSLKEGLCLFSKSHPLKLLFKSLSHILFFHPYSLHMYHLLYARFCRYVLSRHCPEKMNKVFYVVLPEKPSKPNAEKKKKKNPIIYFAQKSLILAGVRAQDPLCFTSSGEVQWPGGWNHLKSCSLTYLEVDTGCRLTSLLGPQCCNIAHLYSPPTSSLHDDQCPRMNNPRETRGCCMAFSDLASEVTQHHLWCSLFL